MVKLSRREFLRMAGVLASATVLGACAPQTPTEEVVEVKAMPTATPPPPTPTEIAPTATPVAVVEPGGFEMVLVEPGSFVMGSNTGPTREVPAHTVNITTAFYMNVYEVTYEQWDEFYEDTRPGIPKLDRDREEREKRPVGMIWYEATEFCNWLSERAGLGLCFSGRLHNTKCDFAANGYRLPTEAEWEYAARGGARSRGYTYAGSNDIDAVAWYMNNADDRQPIGLKAPNELGLYDMSGNLMEWCWDWYAREYYTVSPADDPRGPEEFNSNVFRRQKIRRGGF